MAIVFRPTGALTVFIKHLREAGITSINSLEDAYHFQNNYPTAYQQILDSTKLKIINLTNQQKLQLIELQNEYRTQLQRQRQILENELLQLEQ